MTADVAQNHILDNYNIVSFKSICFRRPKFSFKNVHLSVLSYPKYRIVKWQNMQHLALYFNCHVLKSRGIDLKALHGHLNP